MNFVRVADAYEDHDPQRSTKTKDARSHKVCQRQSYLRVFLKVNRKITYLIFITLITLLRIPYLGQIGSTKKVLAKWHKYGILNRVIRVTLAISSRPGKGANLLYYNHVSFQIESMTKCQENWLPQAATFVSIPQSLQKDNLFDLH